MKLSRREMMKKTFIGLAGGVVLFKGNFIESVFASAETKKKIEENLKDFKIKTMDYIHDVNIASNPENKELYEKLAKIKVYSKNKTESFNPRCINCKHFKNPTDDGYGKCAMVGATGKKPGKLVYKEAICKVWARKKAS